MNLLVIGSGGREHALVWKLKQSPHVDKIFCAPGNAGIARLAECVPIAVTDVEQLLRFAKHQKIDLTVVGPEAPLALGIVDLFKKKDLKIFGPTQKAARLEASKVFTKEFCERYKIPQARFKVFETPEEANAHVKNHPFPLVIKAEGLAQGKGVRVCFNLEEALLAIDDLLVKKCFGEAGSHIVIEEFLKGEEASFIAMVDGEHILPLASSKDHKRLLDENQGPNTGGMGAISPAPHVTRDLYEKIMEQVMRPTVRGMAESGFPFVGFLYAGIMVCEGEPKLLEFNVRLGDPETQALLPRLKSDLVEMMEAALLGRLDQVQPSWETRVSCCVVMASQGYPEKYETGFSIQGLESTPSESDVFIFHAGTRLDQERIVTNGGRVLGVSALGENLKEAIEKAYKTTAQISWKGVFFRKDIGKDHA